MALSLGKRLKSLFSSKRELDEAFYEELEDMLIESDLGAKTAMELVDALETARETRKMDRDSILKYLHDKLSPLVKGYPMESGNNELRLYLLLGVNGVGKTTSIAKLARWFEKNEGKKPLLAAGDTFRAAAIDQLQVHGKRLDCRVISQQPGADPGAVIYDALESAVNRGEEIVLADTAGRMHNKKNLVRELEKIHKIVSAKVESQAYKKLLVLDATTGQNALRQAELFHEAVGIDAIILAKMDSAAKGGIIIPIQRDLGIPVAFIGTGEGYDDLQPFDGPSFLNALLGRD
jgi:fused signal recognition particle receptor